MHLFLKYSGALCCAPILFGRIFFSISNAQHYIHRNFRFLIAILTYLTRFGYCFILETCYLFNGHS